jgi:hypothetical protein
MYNFMLAILKRILAFIVLFVSSFLVLIFGELSVEQFLLKFNSFLNKLEEKI